MREHETNATLQAAVPTDRNQRETASKIESQPTLAARSPSFGLARPAAVGRYESTCLKPATEKQIGRNKCGRVEINNVARI